MGAPKVTDAAIKRAINAAQGAGIPIGAVVVNNVEGSVRIEVLRPEVTLDAEPDVVQLRQPKAWPKRFQK